MNDRDDRTNAHPHGGPAPPALQIMEAALGYNHHGLAVLPLHSPGENGSCSCGDEDCSSPGKRPYTHRGLHDASTDPDQIRRWWREWPDANVGIRTGTESGLIVLDVDPDHGGDESLAQLEALQGPLPPYPLEEIRAAVREHAGPQFLSKGITSVTTMPFHADELRAMHELHAAGELPLRARFFYQAPHTISVDGFFDSALVPGFGDDMLRFGGLKIFVTGIFSDGLGNRVQDYKWTQEELNDVVYRAHIVGIPVAMHVSGGGGPIERALTAVEAAQRRHAKPVRHRLEHASQLSDPDHVRRIRELGMRVTITRARQGSLGQTGGSPWKTFVREGLEPIAISDTTGSTPEFSPLGGIASLVASPGEGGATPPGESVTFAEALRMWTLWAARGNSEERDKGSIRVGKLGDFAVLSADPRGRDGAEIFDINVDTTILGGDVVFERSPT